jgi:hypothetical protein
MKFANAVCIRSNLYSEYLSFEFLWEYQLFRCLSCIPSVCLGKFMDTNLNYDTRANFSILSNSLIILTFDAIFLR